MCVTPGSGSSACGRPAATSAADSRTECATTTLSSASPWMISSGRSSFGASSISEFRVVHLRVLVRMAEVALGVVRVVEPPVGDRRARDRRVEHVRPAQHRERGQVPAVGPAADGRPWTDRGPDTASAAACSASTWSSSVTPAKSNAISRSQSGPRPGVPRPSAISTAKPWSASHCGPRKALRLASTRCACGPPYGSSSTGSWRCPARARSGTAARRAARARRASAGARSA